MPLNKVFEAPKNWPRLKNPFFPKARLPPGGWRLFAEKGSEAVPTQHKSRAHYRTGAPPQGPQSYENYGSTSYQSQSPPPPGGTAGLGGSQYGSTYYVAGARDSQLSIPS